MQPKDLGVLNPWLRNIRDVYRLHVQELSAINEEPQRYRRLVELNVEEQCVNVIKTAVFQKAYLSTQLPTVHGWVLDIHTGRLVDLRIDFARKLSGIREVYDLGHSGG
jgi:carbonic anhydrase